MRVAVVYGGRSGEHEVSLRSAKSVMEALDPQRYVVLPHLISKEGKWSPKPIQPEPRANAHIDVVFPVLHGTFGEDGTLQGLCELADLPYVGPGVFASAASMDKEAMKLLCRAQGLPVVEYVTLRPPFSSTLEACKQLPFPMFVKPANLGSSVGISKVHNEQELRRAIDLAAQFDRKVIVERAIVGRELECGVLGNGDPVASLPSEIIPSREFYDYEDKYVLDKAQCLVPASLPDELTQQVRRLAIQAYQAVQGEGMARVDFLLETATSRLYISEINTIPGFTSISMFPKMWEHAGLPLPKLVDRLIELALERHEAKQKLRYSFG
ncbi:MAG: D-alanine--D-alanine ligase [Bryobacteraceae bacterium]|nr:D-alanine--D-alanine ligase [Bryobacteraceae bacterium]